MVDGLSRSFRGNRLRRLGIVDPRLAESVLTDAVSYWRRDCVEHRRRDQLNVRGCIGIGSAIFSSSVSCSFRNLLRFLFWTVGMRAAASAARSRSSKRFPASAQAAGHGEQMRTVLAIKQYKDLQLSCPKTRTQLIPRVRNTCPIVQILHCLDPISMC